MTENKKISTVLYATDYGNVRIHDFLKIIFLIEIAPLHNIRKIFNCPDVMEKK